MTPQVTSAMCDARASSRDVSDPSHSVSRMASAVAAVDARFAVALALDVSPSAGMCPTSPPAGRSWQQVTPDWRHAGSLPALVRNPCASVSVTDRLAAVVSALRERHTLTRRQATARIRDLESVVAWADAARAELVVAAVGPEAQALANARELTGRSVRDVAACELGAALGMSAGAAIALAEESRALCNWLPMTLSMLREGHINRGKARIVTDGAFALYGHLPAGDLTDDIVLAAMVRYESVVTARIRSVSRPQLRRIVDLAIARIAPESVAQAHERAREQRRVDLFDVGDGMSLLQAHLPSLEATRVWQVLEHCAMADSQAPGSLAARMADALVAIVDGSSEMPAHLRHQAAEVQVVVSVETLLGVSSDAAQIRGTDGWMTADAVRELAQGSPLRRLLADDRDGHLVDYGRRTYRPPAGLRDHVRARDITCRAPGCTRPAMRCDVDHVVAWEDGGPTDVANLACLCRRHHLLKTFAGWDYHLDDSGAARWRLPGGEQLVDPPTPVLAVGSSDPPF